MRHLVPRNSYAYLKIDLDDRKTLPLNILQVGYFETGQKKERKVETLQPSKMDISHDKASKRSIIHVVFDAPKSISQINFAISAPNFYSRRARAYKNVTEKIRKREKIRQQELAAFQLNSNRNNEFETVGLHEKDFYIEIENRDNPPLEFSKINFSYVQNYLVADLKAGETYTINAGDAKLTAPDYDLSADLPLHQNLPEAKLHKVIRAASKAAPVENARQSFWQQSWFLWLCIGVGGMTIAFFTVSLIRDLK